MKEGHFEGVKLEGGARYAEHVRAIVGAGIPMMGHIGLLPQSVHAMGGFRVQGREQGAAERLIEDARALEQAGVFSIVLEGLPSDVGARITQSVSVPTIGIGAGPHCDGQVLVSTDLLGLHDRNPPFAKKYADLSVAIVNAARAFVEDVRTGASSLPAVPNTGERK